MYLRGRGVCGFGRLEIFHDDRDTNSAHTGTRHQQLKEIGVV